MRQVGTKPQSHWREAGAWWDFEPYREYTISPDTKGILRERAKEAPTLGLIEDIGQRSVPRASHREEWSLRERKIRDEKVSAACGHLPTSYYERREQEKRAAAQTAWALVSNELKPPQPKTVSSRKNAYVPLHCWSGYAFGRSTLLAEEIATLAALGGCPAAALTDPHALTGASEFARACERNGIKPLIGSSIELPEGGSLVLIARNAVGYQNLSRLISECHLEEPRGYPLGSWERLERHHEGLICLTGGDQGPLDRLLVRRNLEQASALIERLKALYGPENLYLEVERSYLPWQISVEQRLLELSEKHRLLPVAGGVITHARRSHFPAQDVLVCADTLALIEDVIGRKPQRHETQTQVTDRPSRALNAERFLRDATEMQQLFADRTELLENSIRLAESCEDRVLPRRTELPPLFTNDAHALKEIVSAQASLAYRKITGPIRTRLNTEVDRIVGLGFATHFLVAWDMCRWSTEQGIHFSGRGSVVDSAVAFVLGFSRIDALRHGLHFDRFLPPDGNKRPDIDIDFEARRRDDVRGYITRKYGLERTASVCAIGAYCTRGIIREVSKVFGLPDETIRFLSKKLHASVSPDEISAALDSRPELRAQNIPKERFQWVMRLATRLMDIPRNMRTHSSGFVICSQPIRDIVPVMHAAAPPSLEAGTEESGIRMMQWDKRSAKHFFDKFDVLCLRGQDVMSRVEEQIQISCPDFSSQRVATDNPETYRAMRSGELIGIPQSASPAMRQAHIRLRTQNLADASLVQAGIRPGVGGAVKINELIARRRGKHYSFDHPELERILGHTYGIIVFQEQVDQLLQAFCGCTGGEAEDIRDNIHKRRREDFGVMIREKILEKILANGHSVSVAEQVFEYIAGFKGYGFAQGHALAFAEISVRCIHLMQHHPAEYFAALLSSQPAGYYSSYTLANEARSRGVQMLPPDVNRSLREFCVEEANFGMLSVPGGAIRTGLMQITGLNSLTVDRVLSEPLTAPSRTDLLPLHTVAIASSRIQTATRMPPEESQPPRRFLSFWDFVNRVSPNRDELEILILSGALDSLHPNRRAMLWAIPDALAYQAACSKMSGSLPMILPEPPFPTEICDFSIEEKAAHERGILGMDIQQHLMAFERAHVASRGGVTTQAAKSLQPGKKAIVVGNPIRLRFPPTPSGKRVVFFDLEDETGLLNVTCFDRVYQQDGKAIVSSPYVTLIGEVQDRDGHPAFLGHRVFSYQPTLLKGSGYNLPVTGGDFLMG